MIKLARISAAFLVAMIAVASFGGILAHSRIPSAKERGNEQPGQAEVFRIGQKVVTAYEIPPGYQPVVVDLDGRLRIYTVDKIEGEWVRLVSESIDGWIESMQIVHLDEAIDFYTKQIQDYPPNGQAYEYRGMVWYHKGENKKAIADYTEAIRIEPDGFFAYGFRAQVYCEEAEFDKAIADYNEIIRIEPEEQTARVHLKRGQAWARKNSAIRRSLTTIGLLSWTPRTPGTITSAAWLGPSKEIKTRRSRTLMRPSGSTRTLPETTLSAARLGAEERA